MTDNDIADLIADTEDILDEQDRDLEMQRYYEPEDFAERVELVRRVAEDFSFERWGY